MKFLSKKAKNQFISEVVILAVIFGFAAGVVGQIVADVYIDPWRQDYDGQNLNTNQNVSSILELRRVKKFLGIEQDFEVDKSVQQIAPVLAGIYSKKGISNNLLNQIYLPQDLRGSAFILTSDGWLVSHQSVIGNLIQKQLVVVYDNDVFSVDKIIKDSITDIVFLKISANDLPVVILGDSDEIVLGQLAITLNSFNEVVVTNIKDTNFQDSAVAKNLVFSTESFSQLISLKDLISPSFIGGPLINLGGEVVGVIQEVDEVATVIPLNQFRTIILGVLRNNLVSRPDLGIDYLDLAQVVGLDRDVTQGLDKGALVYIKPSRFSPAGEVEIQKNDIILSVDGQPVDQNNNLTSLVQQYQPGDEIELEILRDGQQLVKRAILGLLAE